MNERSSETLHVLIVEDTPTDAKLVARELRNTGYTIQWERVDNATAMRAALNNTPWDLIICDWSMPNFSAMAALDLVKTLDLDIPFIIVSGTVGEEWAVEAMRIGAQDYVLKDKLARLAPAVERELRERHRRDAHGRAKHALLISEARFTRLAESGIVGICTADVYGNIHDANDAYLQMVGYSREELRSGVVRWADMTPPSWHGDDDVTIAAVQARGVAPPQEKELIRRDGSRMSVLIGVAMLDYPNCIAFQIDLTERKRAEDALRHIEAQLRQAQKMEAIGSLAGGIAHDFNNLLSVILSYSALLASDLRPGDPMRADLEEIRLAGERAAELTRQLLVFSRQQVLQPRLVNLDDVVAQTERMLRRLIGEDVELTVLGTPALATVRVDPNQIGQVIMNLAVNARDAMPAGGKLTIETANVNLDDAYAAGHMEVTPGPHVMLAVTDTGTGIDDATQVRMFEPFFTTKEPGKGTGLGLATVFGIVKQSGGSLGVYSELGQGTTFKVYFPRADEQDVDAQLATEIQETATLRGAETVLLVEDDEGVRGSVLAILRRYGYHVLEAQSGGDALLISEQHRATIHLLLTDVIMPRMSGQQLAERLAAIRPAMRVLYMSGYTDRSIVHHGVLDSDIAFIQKPIMPEALAKKIRQVLDTPARTPNHKTPK